ncbi:hypothetical protein GGS21DRAFT_494229 [Xylaria nigripes]|nr:hypothetical protein GGS21DRAFT_494229 [Xylaria nigripes]
MPTYLCHGFRWHRKSIRYFIAKHDIEDGTTEWVIAPHSEAALIEHFYHLYSFLPPVPSVASASAPSPGYRNHRHVPSNESHISHTSSSGKPTRSNGMNATANNGSASQQGSNSPSWPRSNGHDEATHSNALPDKASKDLEKSPAIKLLEEFDPRDESIASGPWAYVTDHVVRIDTSVSIADEMFRYETRIKRDPNRAMYGPSDEYGRKVFGANARRAGWLEKLRDQLQRGESIRWYVVVCGDEERDNSAGYNGEEEILEEENEEAYKEGECEGGSARSQRLRQSQSTQSTEPTAATKTSVIEGGFEYRIPELAGLAVRMPVITPERKQNRLTVPTSQKDLVVPSASPPKSPLPRGIVSKVSRESPTHLRAARSTLGLRKLFSLRRSQESV